MALSQPASEWAAWSVEGHPIIIEFSPGTLEEICAAAVDGLYRFRHGGMEIGGVLYGAAEDGLVRIAAFRPLNCEHAFGPRFMLSETDRAALRELIAAPKHDASLRGLAVVGWYHSHTRSEIALSPRDLEIYDRYFPGRSQVALVIRPDHYGPARAGFFFRECDGVVHAESSYREFLVKLHRRGPEPPQPGAAEGVSEPAAAQGIKEEPAKTGKATAVHEGATMTVPGSAPPLPSFAEIKPSRTHKWMWLALPMCLLLAAGIGVALYYRALASEPPLSLWVADMGGQLLIEWDRSAKPIREAESATLEILDGKQPVAIRLDGDRLREGSIDYVRKSEVVDVRLRVKRRGGGAAQEMIRFVGQPVEAGTSPAEVEAVRQRDELKAEVDRLRAELENKDAQLRRRRRQPAVAPLPQP